jgi:hypothetical protein
MDIFGEPASTYPRLLRSWQRRRQRAFLQPHFDTMKTFESYAEFFITQCDSKNKKSPEHKLRACKDNTVHLKAI